MANKKKQYVTNYGKKSSKKRVYIGKSSQFKKNFQSGIRDANDFYIHYNSLNIGTRGEKTDFDIVSNWARKRDNVNAALRREYIKLWDKNLKDQNGASLTISALSAAMGINQTELLNALNKEIVNSIMNRVNSTSLQTLSQIGRNEIFSSSSLQNLTNEINADVQFNGSQTQKLLKILAMAIELIQDQYQSDGVACILADVISEGKISEIGTDLYSKLDKFINDNNGKSIKPKELIKAAKSIQNLAFALKYSLFKSKETEISEKGLRTSLRQNIISTNVAEAIALNAIGTGFDAIKTTTSTVGSETVNVDMTGRMNTFYNEWTSYGENVLSKIKNKTQSIVRKADLIVKDKDGIGFEIKLSNSKNGNFFKTLNINLGISTKFYTGQNFKDLDKQLKGTITSGSGGSLANAIATTWPQLQERYYVYNYIAHQMYNEYTNDLLLRRMLIRLFSSAGGSGEDFAQIILVNGQLVTLWDLMQYIFQTKTFLLSSSMLKGKNDQAISLTIPERKNIIKDAKTYYPKENSPKSLIHAWTRSRAVNLSFHRSRIQADVHLGKLLKSIDYRE